MTSPIYTRLDHTRQQIRLLIVRAGLRREDLRCSLRVESLDNEDLEDEVPYDAISYTWGDLSSTVQIQVNGQPLDITANLEAALRDLRKEEADVTIWADAICINQKNIQERNEQVRIMGRIYRQAQSVIAWLGSETDFHRETLDHIELLGRDESQHWTREGEGTRCHVNFGEMSKVFHCSWWTRVWTVQEPLLARNLLFAIGARRFPEALFSKLEANYSRHCDMECCKIMRWISVDLATGIHPFDKFNQLAALRDNLQEQCLLALISKFRTRSCGDPLDKIYGYLNLADDSLATPIVDYLRSPFHVYRDFALSVLESDRGLQLFSHIIPTSSGVVSSWIPTWDGNVDETRVVALNSRCLFSEDVHCHASGNSKKQFQILSPRVISITGCICDDIVAVAGVSQDISVGWSTFQNAWHILGIDKRAKQKYHDGHNWRNAFCFLLLSYAMHQSNWSFDRIFTILPYHKPMPRWARHWVMDRASLHREILLLRVKDRITIALSRLIRSEWQKSIEGKLESQVRIATYATRFAVTSKGYLGLVPAEAVTGDKICIFLGGKVPFVLRQASSTIAERIATDVDEPCYKVLGDSYVHGLMYGEAIEMIDKGDVKVERLFLV